MFFLYENLLYLIVIPSLFFFFSFRVAKNSMQGVFSKYALAKISLNEDILKNSIRYRLFLLIIVCFILALSRPVMSKKIILNEQEITPLVIALDVSKSMSLKDIYPSRLDFAKNKIKKIVENSRDMSIGIILFDKNAYMAYPMSEDTSALSYMLQHIFEKQKFEANSNIFSALEASAYMLEKYKSKNIILISDGANSNDITEELKYIKDKNLRVYAIGMATKDEGLMHSLNPILQKMAIESGGDYEDFSWGDEDINSILTKLKKKSIKETRNTSKFKQYKELFSYPLAFGLVILFFVFNSFIQTADRKQMVLYFLVFSFFMPNTKLYAGVLDFFTLQRAKDMYQNEQYLDSAKLYESVAQNHQGYYNFANALYKAKAYKKAIKAYKKSLSKDKSMNAKIFHNIANAHVKVDELEVAKKYYKKALKETPDPLTKENLALVNIMLIEREKAKKKKRTNKAKPDEPKLKGISIAKVDFGDPPSSDYMIELKNLVLSEEDRWRKLLEKQEVHIFLHKIKTTRTSKNVEQAW